MRFLYLLIVAHLLTGTRIAGVESQWNFELARNLFLSEEADEVLKGLKLINTRVLQLNENQEEDKELRVFLYDNLDDERSRLVLSSSESLFPPRIEVARLLIRLTSYDEVVLGQQKVAYTESGEEIPPVDKSSLAAISEEAVKKFKAWYEVNYKNTEGIKVTQKSPEFFSKEAKAKQSNGLRNVLEQPTDKKTKPRFLQWFYWVLGLVILGGAAKLVLNGRKS